jgi:radical SAM superfamily enzyme YgiQ (UPF0313 family)
MRVLFVRPDPGNERFGLGPFFRAEPLGLLYIGAVLRKQGHEVTVVDLRFSQKLPSVLRRVRPQIVGIAGMHALEFDQVLDAARKVRRWNPEAFVLVGGHAIAAYPDAMRDPAVDAVCVDDGEEILPALADALCGKRPLHEVPGLLFPDGDGFRRSPPLEHRTSLDVAPLPDRTLVEAYRTGYQCLMYRPAWLIETARGCPFRCNFCSVWQLYGRSFRERSIDNVVRDFQNTGPHIFVVDDLFWHHKSRSLELARALIRANVRKKWVLVQTRTDVVLRNAELLEAWREVAERFDIFFGLEAATDQTLDRVNKDLSIQETVAAVELARSLRYGVTGNFLIDPNWAEEDFHNLWSFVEKHQLQRAGFTLLTPLPGTTLFAELSEILKGQPWFKYDMHHVLWEPKLGAERFFEMYAETWRRSVLNMQGNKKVWQWLSQVSLSNVPNLIRILLRTQRMMRPKEYLAEHFAGVRKKAIRRLPIVKTEESFDSVPKPSSSLPTSSPNIP